MFTLAMYSFGCKYTNFPYIKLLKLSETPVQFFCTPVPKTQRIFATSFSEER